MPIELDNHPLFAVAKDTANNFISNVDKAVETVFKELGKAFFHTKLDKDEAKGFLCCQASGNGLRWDRDQQGRFILGEVGAKLRVQAVAAKNEEKKAVKACRTAANREASKQGLDDIDSIAFVDKQVVAARAGIQTKVYDLKMPPAQKPPRQRKPAAAAEPEESSDEELDDVAAADAAADAASAAEAKAEAADVLHEAAVLKEIKATKSLARCWQPEDFTWPQYLVGFDVVKAPGNSALSEAAAKQRRVQFEKWARAVGKQKDAQHASRLAEAEAELALAEAHGLRKKAEVLEKMANAVQALEARRAELIAQHQKSFKGGSAIIQLRLEHSQARLEKLDAEFQELLLCEEDVPPVRESDMAVAEGCPVVVAEAMSVPAVDGVLV